MVKDSVRKAARSTYALYALVGPRIEIVDAVFDTALILEQHNTPKPKAAPFGRKFIRLEKGPGILLVCTPADARAEFPQPDGCWMFNTRVRERT